MPAPAQSFGRWKTAPSVLGLEVKPHEPLREPAAGCGYSAPTPVTDGQVIYACYGSGIVCCYDLEGKRRWSRYFDLPAGPQYGRSASPVLAGGKLLITLSNLMALEPGTGASIWQAEKAEPSYGTPAVAKIGQNRCRAHAGGNVPAGVRWEDSGNSSGGNGIWQPAGARRRRLLCRSANDCHSRCPRRRLVRFSRKRSGNRTK